ncbi:hypothetical protein BGX31_005009 [Mortierella sp. GBA43]|nr:hypothetical protein BGX31_005009 [Mortierella sp. GBA43]
MSQSNPSHEPAQDTELPTSNMETRQDDEGCHDQDQTSDHLFQDVVFYLNPFLGRTRIAELEAILCANGAQKAQTSSSKDSPAWTGEMSRPTHIITDDLDFPDFKHAKARGIHIVTLAQFDRKLICDGVQDYGGLYTGQMTSNVTHMVTVAPAGEKYNYAMDHPELGIKVVLPHWLERCINLRRRLPETIYQFPDPPMLNPDYVPEQVQGDAPQLYVNNLRAASAVLNAAPDNHIRCLDRLHIYVANDLTIVQEFKPVMNTRIKEAGGILVNDYSSDTVDIVICRYRAGRTYIKASKDGKTVGSIEWLLHVLQTGELSSPKASLLHYPVPPEYIEGMSSLVISVTNYSGRIREYLKRLIRAAGATYLPTMASRVGSKPTTHLICGNASGEKYQKGNEWNIKVVNHLWLEESFQAWSIQSEARPRFTVFPLHNQLSLVFGAKILPESLDAWINPGDDEGSVQSQIQPSDEASTSTELTLMDISGLGGQSNGRGQALEQRTEQSPSNTDTGQDSEQGLERRLDDGDVEQDAGRLDQNLSDLNMVLSDRSDRSLSPPFPPTTTSKKVSTTGKQAKSDVPIRVASPSPPPAEPSDVGNPALGSVRVVSRKRGAALQASKALQKIVPDMNNFQEELRDEKKASKRKKKSTNTEELKESDSMDMDVDEADTKPSTTKKAITSPTKRKRLNSEKPTPVESDEDGHKEVEGPRSGPNTPTKKPRRGNALDKEKAGEDATTESAGVSDQPAGTGTGTPGPGTPVASSKQKRVRYITTGVKEQSASQIKALKALGIMPTTAVEKCTHLVATSITRTGKFLIALLQGKVIVHEDDFRIEDPANEQKLDIRLYDSLHRAREKRVFENCVFYLSPSMKQEMPLLKAVIEAGGGKAATLLQTGLGSLKERLVKANQDVSSGAVGAAGGKASKGKDDEPTSVGGSEDEDDSEDEPEKEIVAVVSSEKDRDMWQPILDAGAHVYSHDVISLSVLTQKLDLGKTHALA